MRILAALSAIAVSLAPVAAEAQQSIPPVVTINPTAPVVTIGVSESAAVAPDIAYLTLAVVSQNKDRKVALADNRRLSDAVIAALKAKGVASDDIERSFTIGEAFDYTETRRRSKGFAAVTRLTITVRDLDTLSDLVVAATDAGSTGIESPDFDLANKQPVIERLTEAATKRARARAEFHARLNGFGGVRLIAVSDDVNSGDSPMNRFGFAEAVYAVSAGAAESTEAGPVLTPRDVNIAVRLSFAYEMVK
jgi:uncharacterized protein